MIVVDASVVLEMLTLAPRADAAFARTLLTGETLHAPHLIDVEVAHSLRRLARQNGTARTGEECLEDFAAFSIVRYDHLPLLPRIWELRGNLSAYDASYVALAELLECPLLTSDARLARAGGHEARIELLA